MRSYPEKLGRRIWLSRLEQQMLLEVSYDDPRRRIALQLALNSLYTSEVVEAEAQDIHSIASGHLLQTGG